MTPLVLLYQGWTYHVFRARVGGEEVPLTGDAAPRRRGPLHGPWRRQPAVSADDLEIARRFLSTLATAADTGERELLYPFLASDVEWVTPRRTLAGIDEVREQLTWLTARVELDLDFEATDMRDLGDGRIVTSVHETYRLKTTGEAAHVRDRLIELTIRERKIARYERTP